MASICLLLAMAVADLSQSDLARLNESSLRLVHSFDAQFDVFEGVAGDVLNLTITRFNSPRLDLVCHWARQGEFERLSYELKTGVETRNGIRVDRAVFVTDGINARILENWNNSSPPTFKIGQQGPIRATMRLATRAPAGFPNVRAYFLLGFSLGMESPPVLSLSEVLDNFNDVSVTPGVSIDGRDTYKIEARDPKKILWTKAIEIYLDPSVGYLARKVVTYEDLPIVGRRVMEREVVRFDARGNGVFFPMEARQFVRFPAKMHVPTSEVTATVTKVKVNDVLSSDLFRLQFPEGLLVHEFPGDKSTHDVRLWGANDRPLRTITSDEYREFLEATSPPNAPRFPRWLFVIAGLLAIGAIFAVAFRRRFSGR